MACGESSTNILHVNGGIDLKMADMSRTNFIFDYHGATRDSFAIDEVDVMEALSAV